MNVKRTIIAVAIGAGIVGGSVACSSSDNSSQPSKADNVAAAQAWGASNYAAIQQTDSDASAGDIDAAVADWNSIDVPPIDAADWNQATDDLNKLQSAYDSGDTVNAENYAVAFQDDVTGWATAFEQATGQNISA